MDSSTAAIEQDIAFGFEEASDLALRPSPTGTLFGAPQDAAEAPDSASPDLILCQKAAAGNLAAFEMIYQRYHRRTYSLCFRMTSSHTEAEDLTQEVFIQLFRKVGSFRGDSAFSTWLHRLTVNQVLMHFRRRSVKNEKVSDDGEMPDQAVHGTSNPNKMPVVDRIALKNAIAELPRGYRNVFVKK
jgi:RNA polymerase sigma-70 factor (ECF subfamily)